MLLAKKTFCINEKETDFFLILLVGMKIIQVSSKLSKECKKVTFLKLATLKKQTILM